MRVYILFILILLGYLCPAQTDTLRRPDTPRVAVDTLPRIDSLRPDTLNIDSLLPRMEIGPQRYDTLVYKRHPFVRFTDPVRLIITEKEWKGKEAFFYSLVGLLIFFALIRNTFGRYLQDLSKLFFRTTIKQRQVKEQLMAAPLPSLLLNILFIISGGVYLALVFDHYGLGRQFNFWLLILYSSLGLTLIYLGKFLVLKIMGWLLRLSDATDAYTFVVFTTNKIIGIVLLPFIALLAFSSPEIAQVALTLSFIVVGGLFLYRFYLSYMSVYRLVKLEFLHFLIYLAAFEIAPLLLINKLLFQFLA
ncbi:MAG TPA: DUF4271 domain-containing protein [Chitinophagaceae bacterium]